MGILSQASSNEAIASGIGLFYTNTGCKDSLYKLSMHSIKVPLEIKVRIPIAGPVLFQAGMGPYVSYAFMAQETALGIKNQDILSLRTKKEGGAINNGNLKKFNPFDAGIVFGGDVEIKLPNDAFCFYWIQL